MSARQNAQWQDDIVILSLSRDLEHIVKKTLRFSEQAFHASRSLSRGSSGMTKLPFVVHPMPIDD